jgi:hypothetical protein
MFTIYFDINISGRRLAGFTYFVKPNSSVSLWQSFSILEVVASLCLLGI